MALVKVAQILDFLNPEHLSLNYQTADLLPDVSLCIWQDKLGYIFSSIYCRSKLDLILRRSYRTCADVQSVNTFIRLYEIHSFVQVDAFKQTQDRV